MHIEPRINRLRNLLKEEDLSSVLLFDPSNSVYMSGFLAVTYSRPIVPIISIDEPPVLVIPSLEREHASKESSINDIRMYVEYPTEEPVEKDPIRLIASIIDEKKLSATQIGIEMDKLSIETYEKLKHFLPRAKFRDASKILRHLRMIKDEEEIALIKKAAQLTDVGMEAARQSTEVGKTELDICAEIDYCINKAYSKNYPEIEVIGYDKYTIYSSCRSGLKTTLPHGAPSGRKIRRGDVVINVVIVSFKGYHAENERTFVVGKTTDKHKKIFEVVLEAREKAMASLKAGMMISEVDEIARKIIEKGGYGKLFIHRTGHGIGLDLQEMPFLREGDSTLLQPRMVFSIEPGVYVPGFAGFRHSDTVLLMERRADILTKHERGLIEV